MIRKWTLPLIAALAAIFFFSGAALAVPSCPGPDDSKKTVKADKKKQKKGDDAFVPTSTDCPGPDDGKKTVKIKIPPSVPRAAIVAAVGWHWWHPICPQAPQRVGK